MKKQKKTSELKKVNIPLPEKIICPVCFKERTTFHGGVVTQACGECLAAIEKELGNPTMPEPKTTIYL